MYYSNMETSFLRFELCQFHIPFGVQMEIFLEEFGKPCWHIFRDIFLFVILTVKR